MKQYIPILEDYNYHYKKLDNILDRTGGDKNLMSDLEAEYISAISQGDWDRVEALNPDKELTTRITSAEHIWDTVWQEEERMNILSQLDSEDERLLDLNWSQLPDTLKHKILKYLAF